MQPPRCQTPNNCGLQRIIYNARPVVNMETAKFEADMLVDSSRQKRLREGTADDEDGESTALNFTERSRGRLHGTAEDIVDKKTNGVMFQPRNNTKTKDIDGLLYDLASLFANIKLTRSRQDLAVVDTNRDVIDLTHFKLRHSSLVDTNSVVLRKLADGLVDRVTPAKVLLRDLRNVVDKFVLSSEFGLEAVRCYAAFAVSNRINTRREAQDEGGYYVMQMQLDCLEFAKIIDDHIFGFLVKREMMHAWIDREEHLHKVLMRDLHTLFRMAPFTDDLLAGYRAKALVEKAADANHMRARARYDLSSGEVHTTSWSRVPRVYTASSYHDQFPFVTYERTLPTPQSKKQEKQKNASRGKQETDIKDINASVTTTLDEASAQEGGPIIKKRKRTRARAVDQSVEDNTPMFFPSSDTPTSEDEKSERHRSVNSNDRIVIPPLNPFGTDRMLEIGRPDQTSAEQELSEEETEE